MLCIDSSRAQGLRWCAGGRYGAHRQFDHRGDLFHHADEGIQNGVADSALRPVIFHHHEPATRRLRGLVQGLFVDRPNTHQ